jgi:hypothetical protein
MTHRSPDVMIVELSCTVEELASRLHEVEGASLVRALPPARAVVVLAGSGDAQRLALLPGVVSVRPDALEHPTRSRD